MQVIDAVFYVIALIMSVVVHEVAHGYAAYHFGDTTAKNEGRLTLNPLKHLDPVGSVILPVLLVIVKAPFMIGWAKPVPYNQDNFPRTKRKMAVGIVAIAGICMNILLAVIFGLTIRFVYHGVPEVTPFFLITSEVILINITLAIFNLIPIPPLDGSKVLFSLLPSHFAFYEERIERYSIYILLAFIFLFWHLITPFIFSTYSLLTGIPV